MKGFRVKIDGMKRWIAIVLMMLAPAGWAADSLSAATKALSSPGVFAFGGVGFAGRRPQGEIAFKAIMAQSPQEALAALEKVFASGDAGAKSYALVGIRKLDRERYKELLRTVEGSHESVLTAHGCLFSKETAGDIAKEIDAGLFDSRVQ
jgi:hypothetical protein